MKKQLIDILKGTVIGIGNVAPGLSGGVFAVTLKVYDRLIEMINNIFKKPFKTIKESWGLIVGVLLGILIGFYLIIELIILFPIPTMMLFVGFIVGSIPSIYENIKDKKKKFIDYFAFMIMILIIVALPFIRGVTHEITTSGKDIIILFFLGLIISLTLIIPGLSGSMVLMVMGYYENILRVIRSFIDAAVGLDFTAMLSYAIVLIPIVIGLAVGLIGFAKLISRLFKTHYTTVYAAILGLVIASPFSIIYTMLDTSDPNSYFKNLQDNLVLNIIIGVITFIIGAILSMYLADLEKQKKKSIDIQD